MASRPATAALAALIAFGCPAAAGADARRADDLRAFSDAGTQRTLDSAIRALGLESAVKRRTLAVSLTDISNLDRPRFAQVNGDEMMYAASLPKIGILLAALVEIEGGRLRNTPEMRELMTSMIRVSSNEAATQVMNRVGKYRVNEILSSPRFRLYDPLENGGLWVGKEYGARPAFERDPLHHISHGATATQVARFYYLMASGQLLSPELTRQMKDALSKPAIQHKFVKGMAGRNVALYRKSGTWRQWHADSMLVESPRRTYILVALADDPRGGDWLARLAPAIDDRIASTTFLARPAAVTVPRGTTTVQTIGG